MKSKSASHLKGIFATRDFWLLTAGTPLVMWGIVSVVGLFLRPATTRTFLEPLPATAAVSAGLVAASAIVQMLLAWAKSSAPAVDESAPAPAAGTNGKAAAPRCAVRINRFSDAWENAGWALLISGAVGVFITALYV